MAMTIDPLTQPLDPIRAGLREALDQIDRLCSGLEWNIENHPTVMNGSDDEALAEARETSMRLRALLNTGV